MTERDSGNRYAEVLKEQGRQVITVKGIDWYEYSGFMMPAYLPHCCPEIGPELAAEVLRISGKPFARWDCKFGQVEGTAWWYVIRKGGWSLEQCSRNTRSKIRRGRKHFCARALCPEEVLRLGYDVCKRAEKRYEKGGFVAPRAAYERKVQAAEKISGTLEFFGVFSGKDLVGYSENYVQDNAAFWENIWYHPDYLRKYSSYVLIDEMLSHYLNDRGFAYVSDGCRSISHRTNVQDYFMNVFGFVKEYALLNVVYSATFRMMVRAAYPFRNAVWFLGDRLVNNLLDNVGGVLRQEYIRRACKKSALGLRHD